MNGFYWWFGVVVWNGLAAIGLVGVCTMVWGYMNGR